MNLSFALILLDLKLAARKGSGVGSVLLFYFIASILFIFGIEPSPEKTRIIAPAVIWVCALLVQTIATGRIFADDYEDGTLQQLIMQGDLPEKIILARMFSTWLTGGLLIILSSPFLAVLFGLEWDAIKMLVISLLCGTPLLSVISVTAASLTLGIQKAGAIFGILVFPLYIPVLIFGTSWLYNPESFISNMGIVLAMLLFMLPVGVFAAVAGIKAAIQEGY